MNCSPSRRAGCFMQSGGVPTHRVSRIACLLIGAALALSAQPTIAASPSRLQLTGIPRTEQLKSQFAEIALHLDAKTYRVRAVKFVDVGKNSETVFSLQNVLVNIDDNAVEFADDRRIEPPNLPGYKWIEHGK